jgi:hypothetical protein
MSTSALTAIRAGLTLLAVTFSCTMATAGEATGTITSLTAPSSDAVVTVSVGAGITSRAACNTSSSFSVAGASEAGRVLVAVLSEASQSGATVRVIGTGTCRLRANAEDISSVTATPRPPNGGQPSPEIAVCLTADRVSDALCTCRNGRELVPRQLAVGRASCLKLD